MCFDLPSTAPSASGLVPPTPPTFQSQDGGGARVSQCVMAPAQVCQTRFPRRLQGRRPSGKGRVKSAFQLPGKKGDGGGEREEEKQTRSVCRRHKARYTKGARKGRRGLPGARLIPTPARGLGEECGRRIPLLGPVGELPTSGLGEELSRPAPRKRSR